MTAKYIIFTSSLRIFSRLEKNNLPVVHISADASAAEILKHLQGLSCSFVYIGSPLEKCPELIEQLTVDNISWALFTGDKVAVQRDLKALGIDPDSENIIKEICKEFGL